MQFTMPGQLEVWKGVQEGKSQENSPLAQLVDLQGCELEHFECLAECVRFVQSDGLHRMLTDGHNHLPIYCLNNLISIFQMVKSSQWSIQFQFPWACPYQINLTNSKMLPKVFQTPFQVKWHTDYVYTFFPPVSELIIIGTVLYSIICSIVFIILCKY